MASRQRFGGDWTTEKLGRLRKYLSAYTAILSKQRLSYAYIDAFAGTGYREMPQTLTEFNTLFPELAQEEPQRFLDGSARIALECEPPFQKYIFIEKDPQKLAELQRNLKAEFPSKQDQIIFSQGDANTIIQDLCEKNWRRHRAVLFLDPFGMQVRWATVEAIANTRAIDLWVLFPVGVAINRMLTRTGKINAGWRRGLDEIFGADDWYGAFYEDTPSLFGAAVVHKTASFDAITNYYIRRLKSIFQHVAENPLKLYNSKNIPLYALFFAAGNPKGGRTAVRIAQHILRS